MRNNEKKSHDKGGWCKAGGHQNTNYIERPQQTKVLARYRTLVQLEFSVMIQMVRNCQSYDLLIFTAVRVGHHCHDVEIEI